MTLREFEKRLFRWTMRGLAYGALAAVASYLLALGYTAWREAALERDWARTFGSAEGFARSFPLERKNASARRLEALLEPVGVTFVGQSDPSTWKVTPWTNAEKLLHAYLEGELENPRARPGPVPPEVEAFLRSHADTLDAVRDLLLTAPPPRWDADSARPWQVETPRHLGFVHIVEWLAADALWSEARSDHARATRDLEAVHVMAEALADRLELVFQNAAVAIRVHEAGLVRKLDPLSDVWVGRLAGAYDTEPMRRACAYEAYLFRERGRRVASVPFYRKVQRRERLLWRTFGRLWYRINMVEVTERYLEGMRLLDRLGPCAFEYQQAFRREGRALPWWNAMSRVGILNLGYFWDRAMKLQIDAELSQKVLELRRARDAHGGAWPETLPGIERARCPKARFAYAWTADGIALTFERPAKSQDRRGKITLPLMYTAAARGVEPEGAPRPRGGD